MRLKKQYLKEASQREERFDEIKRKEQNRNSELFKAYFTDYQSPSNMYKKYVQKARQKTQK